MQNLKIISWNVNGIRAAQRKGFLEWIQKESPDILCIQETKAEKEQLDRELLQPEGYLTYWNNAKNKRGYSGTAIFTKYKPQKISSGLGENKFDQEGRTIVAEFDHLVLFNIYFPNGKASEERLQFKLDFYAHLLGLCNQMHAAGDQIIVTGDFNTAHQPIDLKNPKQNENTSGFMPVERAWIDQYLAHGFVDVYRRIYPEREEYTWWTYRANARARNIGWRLDYFLVSRSLADRVKDVVIYGDVMGSDHCPVLLDLA